MNLSKWQEIHQNRWDRSPHKKGRIPKGEVKNKFLNKLKGVKEPEPIISRKTLPIMFGDQTSVYAYDDAIQYFRYPMATDASGSMGTSTSTLTIGDCPIYDLGETTINSVFAQPRTNLTVNGVTYPVTNVTFDTTVDLGQPIEIRQQTYYPYGREYSYPVGTRREGNFVIDAQAMPYMSADFDTNPLATPVQLEVDKKYALQQKIRSQLRVEVINHKNRMPRSLGFSADFSTATTAEIKALQLLKNLITETEWRKYLRSGILSIRGKSGLIYKIVRTQDHIWVHSPTGELLVELCVGGQHQIPYTDRVISKKLIIETNEIDIWRRANIHPRAAIYPKNQVSAALSPYTIQESALLALAA